MGCLDTGSGSPCCFFWGTRSKAKRAHLQLFQVGTAHKSAPLPTLPAPLPQANPLQARYRLAAEERQLVRIVDEGYADAPQAGVAQIGELAGDAVGIADDRNAAHAVRIIGPLFVEHGLADRRAADVLLGQNEVDCRPVGI